MVASEAWTHLLNEVNQKIKQKIREDDSEKSSQWPIDFQQLKRPHFVDMHVYLEAHRFQTKKKMDIPGVETLERCYRNAGQKRGLSTRNCLANFLGYPSYNAYTTQFLAQKPARVQLSLAQSQVHMEFQGRIRDLQQHLPHTIADKQFRTQNEIELRYITLYFFLVFDEFHVCKIISPNELGVLWDEFYSKGVTVALERPAFKERLLAMFREEDDFAFFGLKEAFTQEINRLHQNAFGKSFFD